jgi:hypothetical protein
MNMSLAANAAQRSESLAFLSLSANDLDCFEISLSKPKSARHAKDCVVPTIKAVSQDQQAQNALCDLIKSLTSSKSADEFVARRDRLFPQYMDLMLGLGRILNALIDRAELNRRVKAQLEAAEKFFSEASERLCPAHLKDQALFSLWELGKVVDLGDFINSRPPLPEAKREEDMRLAAKCTTELLLGRLHLDCLGYAISTKTVLPTELHEILSDGMRHFVNGHIAIRFGAQLRQEAVPEAEVTLLPLDDEDRVYLLEYSMAGQDNEEY